MNILFLVIDSLRADRIYGFDRRLRTPYLDRIARNGTRFTQAISSNTVTSPCVATMLTGLYPVAHGVRTLVGYKLNASCQTLAEILSQTGYHTMARVTGPLLEEVGLTRGFHDYGYRRAAETLHSSWAASLEKDLIALEKRKPWFLFLHLWDLHIPRYFPDGAGQGLKGAERYDRCLEYLDGVLGRLLEKLRFEETLIVIHGDHGENLEKPFWGNRFQRFKRRLGLHEDRRFLTMRHGYSLYEMLVRVPLVFSGPNVPKDRVVTDQVRQVDIMPTLLSLVGVKREPSRRIDGVDLTPFMLGGRREIHDAFLELCLNENDPRPENWLYALRTPEWKYIGRLDDPSSKPELFHLAKDPREGKNLARRNADVAAHFRERLRKIREEGLALHGFTRMSDGESQRVQEGLRQLGYLG